MDKTPCTLPGLQDTFPGTWCGVMCWSESVLIEIIELFGPNNQAVRTQTETDQADVVEQAVNMLLYYLVLSLMRTITYRSPRLVMSMRKGSTYVLRAGNALRGSLYLPD